MSAPDDPNLLRFQVPASLAGVRFDRALADLVPNRSAPQLQKLVRRGRVRVDGKTVVRSNFAVQGGESVVVRLKEPEVPIELGYVCVEPDFVVVNKPAGMVTHPNSTYAAGTVCDVVAQRLGPLPKVKGPVTRPGVVHRLDRETSGLLVLARTAAALRNLREQFRARGVEKVYLALVHGAPAEDLFEVDRPLAPSPGEQDRQIVDPAGREAYTAFRVLERRGDFALVECRPRTGRRHQIRVHLWSLGHPIVADKLYAPPPGVEWLRDLPYHALHAAELAFNHPRTAERLRFRAEPPDGFTALWEALGR